MAFRRHKNVACVVERGEPLLAGAWRPLVGAVKARSCLDGFTLLEGRNVGLVVEVSRGLEGPGRNTGPWMRRGLGGSGEYADVPPCQRLRVCWTAHPWSPPRRATLGEVEPTLWRKVFIRY